MALELGNTERVSVVPPPVYEAHRLVMRNSLLLVVEGRVQQALGQVNVLADRAWALAGAKRAA